MAVTKTLTILIVLAITYNQGAARSVDSGLITKNELSSEEGFEMDSDGLAFAIPTVVKKGLIITLKGTIDLNDAPFIVELPSSSGKESCLIQFDFINNKEISVTPAVKGYEKSEYKLSVTPGSLETPFTLTLIARGDMDNNDMFAMTFGGIDNDDPSPQLICKIENFKDINTILVKKGVARVDSLLFEFE